MLKFKINWSKLVGVSLGVVFLISIPIIIFVSKHNGSSPITFKWTGDIHQMHYGGTQDKYPWLSEKIYNSWFMWNSTIWYVTSINGVFAIWILQPILVATILITTICSIFRIVLKKIRVLGFIGVSFVSLLVVLLTYSQNGDSTPTIGVVATTLILILLSWETLKTPKVRNFIMLGIAGISILIFNWSALWIFTSYMSVLIGIYIYKEKPKPTLLILFTIVFIGFILSASIHSYFIESIKLHGGIASLQKNGTNDIRSIGSTIGMILSIILGFILLWIRHKNIEIQIDEFLFKYRKWWIPVAFLILFLISIILWVTSKDKDAWFNFGVDSGFLGSLSYISYLSEIMYGFYWLVFGAGAIAIIFSFKSKKRLDIDTFLILVGFITTLFFFSPFTASLVKIYLAPKAIFIDMQWVSVCPMIIGFLLKGIKLIKKKVADINYKKVGKTHV
ncbi:hypothetical protein C4B24_03695 [Mycoplasma marinum]|uniref:Uncharacterized protein n=2 Tax=Mycoplasma marinum TaxID=1937190 RepID=A0A4R0XT23_9MOLU|nr:hypothetical protein C4B24_03695 [Mycoplasma marinum]